MLNVDWFIASELACDILKKQNIVNILVGVSTEGNCFVRFKVFPINHLITKGSCNINVGYGWLHEYDKSMPKLN